MLHVRQFTGFIPKIGEKLEKLLINQTLGGHQKKTLLKSSKARFKTFQVLGNKRKVVFNNPGLIAFSSFLHSKILNS